MRIYNSAAGTVIALGVCSMRSSHLKYHVAVASLALILLSSAAAKAVGVKSTYLYDLSNFFGPVTCFWGKIITDDRQGETYVLDGREMLVHVFNEQGMEVYRFDGNGGIGSTFLDIAIDGGGGIYIIAKRTRTPVVVRCNYRGEPVSDLNLSGFPPAFSGFSPDRIAFHNGHLYLADTGALRIAVTDTSGNFQRGYDVAPLIEVPDDKRAENAIVGFGVDKKGNVIFTIPVHFSAYVLSPDGKITGFGRPGSAPGKFGIAAGIASDGEGNYYVADTLRCVVLVFDQNLNFQTEFGYRGYRPGNFIAPRYLAVDSGGRVYVSQAGSGRVSVFRVSPNATSNVSDIRKQIPSEKGVIGEKGHRKREVIGAVTRVKKLKTSSEKGKPAARRGHKADGSTGGDGRAAGETMKEGG